jgi:hypothetical protein
MEFSSVFRLVILQIVWQLEQSRSPTLIWMHYKYHLAFFFVRGV